MERTSRSPTPCAGPPVHTLHAHRHTGQNYSISAMRPPRSSFTQRKCVCSAEKVKGSVHGSNRDRLWLSTFKHLLRDAVPDRSDLVMFVLGLVVASVLRHGIRRHGCIHTIPVAHPHPQHTHAPPSHRCTKALALQLFWRCASDRHVRVKREQGTCTCTHHAG